MLRWCLAPILIAICGQAIAQLPRDTPVALMVMREVSARTATPGTRFPLEVVNPVTVEGQVAIPAGARAWGEVVSVEPAGTDGRGGQIEVRLLHVEAGGQQIRLEGRSSTEARRSTRDMAAMSATLGPFALLAKGHEARIKAGERLTGFVADGTVEPALAKGIVLRAETPVTLETLTLLSSENVTRGDSIALAVLDPVQIDGITVIPAGARAFGEVVMADPKSGFGVGGRLGIALLYVEVGGRIIRLDGQAAWSGRSGPARGLSSSPLAGAAAVAVTGRRAEIAAGTRTTGRVLRDTLVPIP